jgi:serine/threonine-protein kinase
MDPQSGASAPDQLIGQTVGNYRVTQKLGEGGMGSVYLAEHPTIGKKVALKVLHAEFSTNPEVAERFFTEAKAVNAIGHPNIVDIVDYGVLQTGPGGRDRLVYFIMEYLNGQTLAQSLAASAPFTPERSLTIALQVADALAASHKTNIVHRDLKPDNIILINRGREADFVKLLDFGIAKLTGNDGLSSHKTRTGLVLGTPAYMSPEQCEGRATVDHRTDIYALGVVLYEMLTGRVPFIGAGYGEILDQHLTQQPVPPSQYRMMSPHIEQVVLKALEKRPDLRYPTMDELIRAMSDPIAYVEAHGGLTGFLQRQLMPSSAPLPPVRLTPSPLTTSTPIPGMTGVMNSPVPGSLTAPSPTTLGAAAGQVQGARSKTPFIIAGALTLAAAAAAVVVVVAANKKKHSTPVAAGAGSGSEVVQTGSGSAQPQVAPPDAAPPPPPVDAAPVHVDALVKTTQSPAMTRVTINSVPPGADIYVNGVSLNKKTPTELTLPSAEVRIALRLKGYSEVKQTISATGEAMTVDLSLKKAAVVVPKQPKKLCKNCLERPD